MKTILQKALLILAVLSCVSLAACTASPSATTNPTDAPSETLTETEVISVVTSVSNQTVSVDIVTINAADRSSGDPIKPTGETRELNVTDDIQLVTMTRTASGVKETAATFSDISENDLLYLYYDVSDTLIKIRVLNR